MKYSRLTLLTITLACVTTATLPAVGAGWSAVDVAAGSGLSADTETWEAQPVDYDNDGDQDVWIGYHDQGAKLWRNNGAGGYTRVAAEAWPAINAQGKVPDRHFCTWADVDGNGLKDAYCTAGRSGGNLVKNGIDNELWLQDGVGEFRDVGTAWGVGDVCGRSHYARFIRADDDARPDLFVGNAPPRQVTGDPCDDPANGLPSEESKLLLNDQGAGFHEAVGSGIGGYGGVRCAEVVDINRDGRDDLFVCASPPQLYRNDGGGRFTDVAAARGLTSEVADAAFGDLDRDGDADLVIANGRRFAYRLANRRSFAPAVRIAAVPSGGRARSVAVGDADGDKDLDVYGLVTNISRGTNPADMVLLNDNLTFTRLGVPAASGVADAVTPLDGNGDGRAEFLVLNGVEVTGPVQLISLLNGP